jgi:UDP-N-acetylmuramyl pentapeptide synthase
MLAKTTVKDAIHALIERKEARIAELKEFNTTEPRALNRALDDIAIECLEHGIATLIELEHTLRLCGCPPEVSLPDTQRRV